MAKQTNGQLTNLVITGTITATSNKQSADFKTDEPRKTAYIVPVSPEESAQLEAFGLSKYTSKNKEDFFCVKLSENVSIYESLDMTKPSKFHASIDEPNFKTGIVKMNIIKGSKNKNDFFRLQALLVNDKESDIELIEQENPFA